MTLLWFAWWVVTWELGRRLPCGPLRTGLLHGGKSSGARLVAKQSAKGSAPRFSPCIIVVINEF